MVICCCCCSSFSSCYSCGCGVDGGSARCITKYYKNELLIDAVTSSCLAFLVWITGKPNEVKIHNYYTTNNNDNDDDNTITL